MLAAMFMIASCGSKSNTGEATVNSEENEIEAATPTYEPAEPPFTFSKMRRCGGEEAEDISMKGIFEISKIALTKVTGKIYYSSQLSGEGDCLTFNIHLKMINDYSQKPSCIQGKIQFLNKDDALLYETSLPSSGLHDAEKGDVVIISGTSHNEIDVDGIITNTKYVRIIEFCAGKQKE